MFPALAASTGARRGELVALRWSDVDLVSGVVHIRRSLFGSRDGLVEKDTKTHQARLVALDATTVDLLTEHRRVRPSWPRTAPWSTPPRRCGTAGSPQRRHDAGVYAHFLADADREAATVIGGVLDLER